jgi:hypothetical protein
MGFSIDVYGGGVTGKRGGGMWEAAAVVGVLSFFDVVWAARGRA